MKSIQQQNIASLIDLNDESGEFGQLLQPLGPGPMEPESIKRQPYDELYLKQKYDRDYWSE